MAKFDSHADRYDEQLDKKYDVCEVPLKIATNKTLRDFGRLVPDFEKEEVIIAQWPAMGRRKLEEGTGIGAPTVYGENVQKWEGDLNICQNRAVDYGDFCSGRLPADHVASGKRTHVLTREANYHPDSGQVWFPTNGDAFVMLLAPIGDDVTPKDFVAFYFDGSCGLQVKPGVWHQPPYQLSDSAEIRGKQGAVFGCVCVDTVEEFNTCLKVPLLPELATSA